MNRLFLLAAISTLLFTASCKHQNGAADTDTNPVVASPQNNAAGLTNMGTKYMRNADGTYGYSEAIEVDSANKMIQSYLTSVGYPQQDNNLRALVFDAAVLRQYLADPNIKSVKFMLAHQPDYIAAGNYGVNAGLNPNAMTMIVVGTSADGSYIKNSAGKVYEHFKPCPHFCESGSSYNSSPLISQ